MESVQIYEVGPRDGLQYEKLTLPTADILQFIELLSKTGLTAIESGSFVSKAAIPQMQYTPEVMQQLQRHEDIKYPVLVPNMHGLHAALECGVREVAVFTAASDAFLEKNIKTTIAGSIERFSPVLETAKKEGLWVRGYISCSMGCPYEGEISLDKVNHVARQLTELGVDEISAADTTGVGLPEAVSDMLDAVLDAGVSVSNLAVHFHDTPEKNAIPKIGEALKKGVRIIDSAVGNLGGCPYAEGASGNVATELVIDYLEAEGFHVGIDKAALAKATAYIFNILGRKPGT